MDKIVKKSPIYTGCIWKETNESFVDFVTTFPEYNFAYDKDYGFFKNYYAK